jgi:hypothetical protein
MLARFLPRSSHQIWFKIYYRVEKNCRNLTFVSTDYFEGPQLLGALFSANWTILVPTLASIRNYEFSNYLLDRLSTWNCSLIVFLLPTTHPFLTSFHGHFSVKVGFLIETNAAPLHAKLRVSKVAVCCFSSCLEHHTSEKRLSLLTRLQFSDRLNTLK